LEVRIKDLLARKPPKGTVATVSVGAFERGVLESTIKYDLTKGNVEQITFVAEIRSYDHA
jgi:hypothetical protein